MKQLSEYRRVMQLVVIQLVVVLGMILPALAQEEVREYGERDHGCAPSEPGQQWTDLLPPLGLAGWKVVGGSALIEREGDEVHGHRAGSRNTFLLSERSFGDFVLEGEIKIQSGGNSGWQVRSRESHPGRRSSRVSGYQLEVDTSDRKWSGGLYGEGNRGWMHSLEDDEDARGAFKVGEWNHYRIELEGGHIRSWVNGVPCADVLDFEALTGLIAFQVHSGRCDVRWRNLRIADLGTSSFQKVAAWSPSGPNPAASRMAFIMQADRSFKGGSGLAPVSLSAPIRANARGGSCLKLEYQLEGSARVHLHSAGEDEEPIVIDIDGDDATVTGGDLEQSPYPVVVPGAGMKRDGSSHVLLIDVDCDRITVILDGRVVGRLHSRETLQLDRIELELPQGENEIAIQPLETLTRNTPS